jgi:murein DD-endopeptidase MepM/ murein hydrolase activator NlpD
LKLGFVRAIAYAGVFLLVAIALTYVPQLPDRRPADTLVSQAASPSWKMRFDTLGRGETLQRVFRRAGLSDSAAYRAIKAASSVINERKVKERMPITFMTAIAESEPSEVILELAIDHLVHITHDSAGWKEREETLPWKTDTIAVSGTIQTNVYAAMYESAAGQFLPKTACDQLTYELADVYQYKVDMSRELQKGDEFRLIAERSVGPHGTVRIGNILAATFRLSGTTLEAVRFTSEKVGGEYFDESGKSMRAAFMKYPVDFRRISSTFSSSRLHPILGYTRAHKGTDYAADAGTPVRAIGDGVVLRATWDNGYGNLAEIRHPNGFVTRYGHMKGFAKGVHSGARVTMGQTIGYVGQTGLATGPHLHFEVLIDGVQHDSRYAFPKSSGDPIPSVELTRFVAERDAILPQVGQIPSNRAYAMNASSNAVQAGQAQPQKPR